MSFPRDANFLNIRLEKVIGGTAGDIAVAITHLDASGEEFNPCKAPGDLPTQICSMPGPPGYFVNEFTQVDGSNTFPSGIFLPNKTGEIFHGWANLTITAHVEMWPKRRRSNGDWEDNPDFAAMRFEVRTFEHPAGGGLFSPEIGTVSWRSGAATLRVNGFAFKNGSGGPIPLTPEEHRLQVTFFGHEDPRNVSSTGYPLLGMSESGVTESNGFWQSSRLLPGDYEMIISDLKNNRRQSRTVSLHESIRFDINVDDLPPLPPSLEEPRISRILGLNPVVRDLRSSFIRPQDVY